MNRRGQLITTEEARPAKQQHRSPCSDCPWARKSLAGWLGGSSREEWLGDAHGETRIECHTLVGAQCAGAAIYRANVCKSPRDASQLKLPADREVVFSNQREFWEHHDMARVARALRESPNEPEICDDCGLCVEVCECEQ